MDITAIFLYPAKLLVFFVASLFKVHFIPFGWEIALTGLVALWLWATAIKVVIALLKRLFGFYGEG